MKNINGIEIGDEVIVEFIGSPTFHCGMLIDHLRDWSSVVIKTSDGDVRSGQVKDGLIRKSNNQDKSHLIAEILKAVKPRRVVAQVIVAAYADGYDKFSDGITLMPDYALGLKHPAGVGHDWLYYMGSMNPFLQRIITGNYTARLWADNWFRDAMIDFGHPYRARIYWMGLRLGGWWGWRKHRRVGHPFTKGYGTSHE